MLVLGAFRLVSQQGLDAGFGDEAQVDLARIQIDAADLHRDPIGQLVTDTGTFTAQLMPRFVILEIICAQLGDMHHAFDEQRIELHENAEGGHTRNRPGKFLAELVADEITLEPRLDIARGFIGAPLVGRAVNAQRLPYGMVPFRALLA